MCSDALYEEPSFCKENIPLRSDFESPTEQTKEISSPLEKLINAASRQSFHGSFRRIMRNSFKTRSLTLKKKTNSRRQHHEACSYTQLESRFDFCDSSTEGFAFETKNIWKKQKNDFENDNQLETKHKQVVLFIIKIKVYSERQCYLQYEHKNTQNCI